MEQRQEVDVKEIPHASEMFGRVEGPQEFTPISLFNRFKIPEGMHYTLHVEPMSSKDKTAVEAYLSKVTLDALQWARENGVDLDRICRPRFTKKDEELILKAIEERGEVAPEKINPEVFGYLPMDTTDEEMAKLQKDEELYNKAIQTFEDHNFTYGILQKYVKGLDNYFDRTGKPVEFETETAKDHISVALFQGLPTKVKQLSFSFLMDISGLTDWEVRSL